MPCEFCTISPEDERLKLAETEYWKVYLALEQGYLGRSILVLKRHCGALSNLSQDEWLDYVRLVPRVEEALRTTFGATMFNWACLMNNAYKSNPPDPHVHWHVRPRYDHPAEFAGMIFDDREFARHYDNRKRTEVSPQTLLQIAAAVQGALMTATGSGTAPRPGA